MKPITSGLATPLPPSPEWQPFAGLDEALSGGPPEAIELEAGAVASEFDDLLGSSPLDALIDDATRPTAGSMLGLRRLGFDAAMADLATALGDSPIAECRRAAAVVKDVQKLNDFVRMSCALLFAG